MQKPLVSVIVPIYNAQNNIVRCVESIRRQTYENLEILLLNDGSKDVSYPVCEMLSKADARIVLIDKENSGVSATRNLGMRMARGKYLQFVDADDTLEPFATELLVQRAEDNNADLVIAAYNRIVPYKPKKEAKLDPLLPNKKKQLTEQLAKFQTFGFLPMGFMTNSALASWQVDDKGGIRLRANAGAGELLLRRDVEQALPRRFGARTHGRAVQRGNDVERRPVF